MKPSNHSEEKFTICENLSYIQNLLDIERVKLLGTEEPETLLDPGLIQVIFRNFKVCGELPSKNEFSQIIKKEGKFCAQKKKEVLKLINFPNDLIKLTYQIIYQATALIMGILKDREETSTLNKKTQPFTRCPHKCQEIIQNCIILPLYPFVLNKSKKNLLKALKKVRIYFALAYYWNSTVNDLEAQIIQSLEKHTS